jgi:predicted TIM-barrel fold metal-dependent hydrolase
MRQLYDVEDLSAATVKKVQAGYEQTRRAGFYRRILCEMGKIESCQVNCLSRPFGESDMPTLLMQDLSIVGMFAGPDFKGFGKPTGIEIRSLADWHRVIDWWFEKYGRYAVAVKSQNAYSRDIDYEQVPGEKVEDAFKKRLANEPLTGGERKSLEDHLFWYAVNKATEHKLPVKLHTGYYAGQDRMPLERLLHNAGSAADLCRKAPDARFVFMHICYPYYEELLAVAKHYANAYVDMCWSWIINPVAAKDFLKKCLVTAPANKVLTFGGDYGSVEPVLGHAAIARRGIALALSELVEEGWLTLADAMELVNPIMHSNARQIFNLAEKTKVLQDVLWTGSTLSSS